MTFKTQGFKANPGLEFANAFSVSKPKSHETTQKEHQGIETQHEHSVQTLLQSLVMLRSLSPAFLRYSNRERKLLPQRLQLAVRDFVDRRSIVRTIWGSPDLILLIFAG